jgi:betaine-aldehyde dehydrogenase
VKRSRSILEMAFEARHVYYDGKAQKSHGDVFHTIDPSTGNTLADIHCANHADIDSAVASATNAFSSWSSTSPIARSRILHKAVHLLREYNDDIAKLETADTGKPFSETSTVDVLTGADVVEYFAALVAGGGLNGETIQLREDAWIYTKKEPLGVCAGIGAWNYPIQMYVFSLSLEIHC